MPDPSPLLPAETLAVRDAARRTLSQIESARRRLGQMEQEVHAGEMRALVLAPISTSHNCPFLGADAVEIALAWATFVATAEKVAIAARNRREGGAK